MSANTVWKVSPNAPQAYLAALKELHPLAAQVLFARGSRHPDEARRFLAGAGDDADPRAMRDMPQAVERIARAIRERESIAVYGDYDCDGVTACALLVTVLLKLGGDAQVYIPDRFEEGYGLNRAALDTLKGRGAALVVTADCGVRALDEAAHARSIGLDLIITDHHGVEAGALPDAVAVLNPNRPDCPYPFKALAGVGVAYRLAQALCRALGAEEGIPESLLDLVAIGTVADVVPLTGENRTLVIEGLRAMNRGARPGVRALLDAAGARAGSITSHTLGFVLGPRLNAAGRLKTALDAYALLMAPDGQTAEPLARNLNDTNAERQRETARVAHDAEAQVLKDGPLRPLLFAASDDFNSGVIGLAAARLVDRYHAPTVVASIDTTTGEARGSCRSVAGFHITQALDECQGLLLRHGGHAAAAGFTARIEALDELAARLRGIAEAAMPDAAGWTRTLDIDAAITRDEVLAPAFASLQNLEPYGSGNARPTFAAYGARVIGARRVGKAEPGQQQPHLQLRVQLAKAMWQCVAFRMGDRIDALPPGAPVDLAFHLEMNEWNGERRLELQVIDIRPARPPGVV